MRAALRRILIVTRTLLRQNRVLIALLLLWPFGLSAIVVVADHGAPDVDDVVAILEQELFYGLVLVGLGASVALGTEQRARRTQQVLGRAVGRMEYLLALGLSAYLPFAGYVLVWLVNATAFAGLLHTHAPALFPVGLAEFAAGLLLCAVGLLFSVLLPQMGAAACTGVVLAALTGAGTHGVGGVSSLFATVAGFTGSLRSGESSGWPYGEAVLVAAVVFAVAVLIFNRKDLKLS